MTSNELITQDGEIVETIDRREQDGATTALLRAEMDSQVVTARQYPRSTKRAMNNIVSLATLDEQTAMECVYALKRSGKPIRGPSIRLAEIIASQWGNCRDDARVVHIDKVNKVLVAEGAFLDLETNRGTRAQVQRRISDKHGRLFSDDMIAMTGNAACAIARRNAILNGVPKAIWRKALNACEDVIRGDVSTMVEQRDKAIKALAHFNLSPEQIFELMDVGGLEDLTLDDIATLRVIYASLKNGEQTVEELLRSITPDKPERVTALTATHKAPEVFDTDGVPSATKAAAPEKSSEPKKAAKPQQAPATALALRRVRRRR